MREIGLMIPVMRSICITGKVVIMDRNFYLLKLISEMRKRGFYGSALIKKRRYWPRGFHRYSMYDYFSVKTFGDVGCCSGEWGKTSLNVFVLKDPDYNIMMM